MQVAVIGGGVIGVCTAYFLADAGHEVVLIERHGNVAEQASFGNAGIVAPAFATPWAAPGMPRKIMSYLFKNESPILLRPTLEPALWRWIRKWISECDVQRYRTNRNRMQRIATYSKDILSQLRQHEHLEYEQTTGFLQLFRSGKDLALAKPLFDLLRENGIAHTLLEDTGVRLIEPGLAEETRLAGGLHFPDEETGNCALFTKQLKQAAQNIGVNFYFSSTVRSIEPRDRRVALQIDETEFMADAVVIAAGVNSAELLEPLGIHVPLYPIKGYAATVGIKDFDRAPEAGLMDESYKVAIARMGTRIRLSGLAEFGSDNLTMRDAALRTLIKVGEDWFPRAANYSSAQFWCGNRPALPDGPPLLGTTPIRNIFVNIGHGSTGWSMAAGSGKVVADIVSGNEPDIDMEGLTLGRFHR